MLEQFLKEEEQALVLFYDEENRGKKKMQNILKSLEAVDDKLDKVRLRYLFCLILYTRFTCTCSTTILFTFIKIGFLV